MDKKEFVWSKLSQTLGVCLVNTCIRQTCMYRMISIHEFCKTYCAKVAHYIIYHCH